MNRFLLFRLAIETVCRLLFQCEYDVCWSGLGRKRCRCRCRKRSRLLLLLLLLLRLRCKLWIEWSVEDLL